MANIVQYIMNPLKTMYELIVSANARLHHRTASCDIPLIRGTNLFKNMRSTDFADMVKSAVIVEYAIGDIILQEGDVGDELYIIKSGTARVYINDMNALKIPLKQLVKGDYFGEQAILGKTNQMRNSTVEATSKLSLIKINGKYFSQSINTDQQLKARLEMEKYKQELHIMSQSTGVHNSKIESILEKIERPTILEFRNSEYIFKAGDKSDNVYMILQGKVKLLVPDKNNGSFAKLLLNRGQLFGELGVIKDAPRRATAIAQSNLKLLSIDGSYFKTDVSVTADFITMVSTLQQIYQLPMRGTVEQYIGNLPELGSAIINIYKLDDGRTIHSSKVMKEDIFTMAIVDSPCEDRFQYSDGDNHLEIETTGKRLVGIKAYGHWDTLPGMCRILLDNEALTESDLVLFQTTGKLKQD